MPPKQWIPVRFGARVQQIWRFMKREELKRDPVADKIVKAVKYFQDNKIMVFIIFLILFSTIIGISWTVNAKDTEDSDAKIAIDEVMLELINTGLNDSNYFKTKFKIQLTDLYNKYPDSKQVHYLTFILNDNTDTINVRDKIDLMKNNIGNEWFKCQAFLISGDNYSDSENYDSAKKEYTEAIKYASSNAQKGYSNYKLGNIYSELNNLDKALNYYEKASDFFEKSKKNKSLDRNQQFSSWVERNSLALYGAKKKMNK